MELKHMAVNGIKLTRNRENYLNLIELIQNSIEKLCDAKSKLLDSSKRGNMASIRSILQKEELEKSVMKNEWVLEQIAERNFERHKELVELIWERCTSRRLIIESPKTAAGIKRNLDIESKLDSIDNRINEIISNDSES